MSSFSTPSGTVINRYLRPGVDTNSFYGRGDLLPLPTQTPTHEATDTLALLQSISMSLSDVQRQLSTIQEQNVQRDKAFQQLEMDIQELKTNKIPVPLEETPKRSRKSPRGLSACVRRIHSALEEEDQYCASERVNSKHNQDVTEMIVQNVIDGGGFKDKDTISYAAKKHHEYLVRLQKPQTNVQRESLKKNTRAIQRRQRLYERRRKQAVGREVKIMQALSEKFMSDEETDSDDPSVLAKRSLKWRSNKLNCLINKLDERYSRSRQAKENCKPLKPRKAGDPSDRLPPSSAPSWALSVSQSSGSSDSASVTPDTPDLQTEIHGPNTTESISSAHDNVSTPPCPVTQSPVTSITSIGNSAGVSPFCSSMSSPYSTPYSTPYEESDRELDEFFFEVTGVRS